MSYKKKFGLFLAGVGAGMAAIAMLTDTLDIVFIVSSTVLVLIGASFYIFSKK